MNRRGFTLIEIMAALVVSMPVMLGTFALTQSVITTNRLYIDESELQSILVSANSQIVQTGRLAENCQRRDDESDGIHELYCNIRRNGVEEIRFKIITLANTKALVSERKVGGDWVREMFYPGIQTFTICDDVVLKEDAANPIANICPIKDKNISLIYAKSHGESFSAFFRIQLTGLVSGSGGTQQELTSSFFVRNSVLYPDGKRYVWGWSDNAEPE